EESAVPVLHHANSQSVRVADPRAAAAHLSALANAEHMPEAVVPRRREDGCSAEPTDHNARGMTQIGRWFVAGNVERNRLETDEPDEPDVELVAQSEPEPVRRDVGEAPRDPGLGEDRARGNARLAEEARGNG